MFISFPSGTEVRILGEDNLRCTVHWTAVMASGLFATRGVLMLGFHYQHVCRSVLVTQTRQKKRWMKAYTRIMQAKLKLEGPPPPKRRLVHHQASMSLPNLLYANWSYRWPLKCTVVTKESMFICCCTVWAQTTSYPLFVCYSMNSANENLLAVISVLLLSIMLPSVLESVTFLPESIFTHLYLRLVT